MLASESERSGSRYRWVVRLRNGNAGMNGVVFGIKFQGHPTDSDTA